MSDLSPRAAARWLVLIVFAPLFLRGYVATAVELAPDEAYYTAWSHALDLSYLDHPPLVAWLIAGSRALLGSTELSVRMPALLAGAGVTVLLYTTARTLGARRRNALWAAATGSATLLFTAGGLLMTPDVPLLFAWALAVYALARAESSGSGRALAGAAAAGAAGFLGKLTLGLLMVWGVAAARTIPWRRRVAALVAATAGLVPVLVWNAQHDWAMFTFHRARVGERSGPSLETLGELVSGQLGLLCLLPAIAVIAAWVAGLRRGAPAPLRFATTLSLGPVASVLVLSVFTKVEPNWIGPAYFGGFVALALWLDRASRAWRIFVAGSAVFAASVSLLAQVHAVAPFLPLPQARDPSAQLHGWRELAAAVRRARAGAPVLTSRYQEASELAFYEPSLNPTTLPHGPRPSQFDLWLAPQRAASLALCVWREGEGPPRGEKVVTAGRRYRLARCRPERWREP